MFPLVRVIKDISKARHQPPIMKPGEQHISHHICWPQDIDFFWELNNGRAMMLFDIGRFALAQRVGLIGAIQREGWALTVLGTSVRFRRRIRPFERFEMRSMASCWDERFMYLEQSIWKKDGECASHVLYRVAVRDENGMIAPDRVFAAMGRDPNSPPIPDWISAWAEADKKRPWPPMQG